MSADTRHHEELSDVRDLAPMRAALRSWLLERGIERDQVDDVVLATSEAVTNAFEHGYQLQPGRVELDAETDRPSGPSEVWVTVSDHGRWRPAQDGRERGRGLAIMRRALDDVEVRTGPSGTVVSGRRRIRRPRGAG